MRPRWWEGVLVFLHRHLISAVGGITAGDWLRLLRENHYAVDLPYWPRAAVVTLLSLMNSVQRWQEQRAYGPAIAGVTVQPPLFVLGHWRTGTTHLHNLFAVDPQFAYPNTYQTSFPHTFLCTQEKAYRNMAMWIPERRPQDNVRFSLETPQEDEFALNVATGCSPYMAWVFPRREEHYERYLTFRGVPEPEIQRWKEAFVYFLKKVTWKHDRPLVLKSPPHTCRIRLLREMFPEARFIHIHRNPYHVFQSTRHMTRTALASLALQRRNWGRLDEGIIRRYRLMYDAFFEERGLITAGRIHEVGFEELEKDPIGQMRTAYEALGLSGFDAVREPRERYVASLSGYRKNELAGRLPIALRHRIADAWQRCFDEWGYRTEGCHAFAAAP